MPARRLQVLLALLSVISSLTLVPSSFVRAQSKGTTKKVAVSFPKAPPTGPPAIVTGPVMPIKLSITDEKVTQVDILVSSIARPGLTDTLSLTRQQADRSLPFEIRPYPGVNSIKLFAVRGEVADTKPSDEIRVQCDPPVCGADRKIPSPGETTGPPKGNVQTSDGKPSAVKIVKPEGGGSVTDVKSVDRTIVIDKTANVGTLMIDVTNSDKSIDHQLVKKFDETETLGIKTVTLKLAKGENIISVYSLDHLGEPGFQDSVKITCTGPKCAAPGEKFVADADDAQKPKGAITIVTPENKATYTDSKTVPFSVTVARKEDATKNVKKLLVTVLNEGKPIIQQEDPFTVTYDPEDTKKPGVISLKALKIGKGENKITVFDPDNRETERAESTIKCEGDCGGKTEAKDKLSVAVSAVKDTKGTYQVKNVSSLDSLITVPKGDIKKIQYDVFGPGDKSYKSAEIPVEGAAEKAVEVPVSLKFFNGLNTIRIYDVAHAGGENDVSLMIECTGENCASDLLISTIPSNSQNTRAIVGLEQAGASTAKSETKPFLNMFFTAPILFDRKHADLVSTMEFDQNGNAITVNGEAKVVWVKRSKLSSGDDLVSTMALDAAGKPTLESGRPKRVWVRRSFLPTERQTGAPRAGFWGDIRLAATPEQLTTTGVLPSNLVNLVASSGTAGNLVQSFDFLAGVEYRLFTGTGSFLSLIPGIKQKTRFFLAGGLGAISPLDATQENPKFFLIPGAASSQRALFEQRYGKPTVDQTHLALVPLDRDRFLRQWYAGIRLKTFFCENDSGDASDCSRFRNSFPAIFDLMVGQSELVTGGTYKRTEVDPVTRISRRKHAFVFRLDGFYPLPFREASFIYIYGTAVMKLGGSQRIENFLVLEPASNSPNINDKAVYVPPVDFLKSLQSNREIYKIGIGINLTELFNRNRPK